MAAQEAIPGLDGPEWGGQSELPFEENLSDIDVLHELDTLHTTIDDAEQAGYQPELNRARSYQKLSQLAIERGLMTVAMEEVSPEMLERLENNIVDARVNLRDEDTLVEDIENIQSGLNDMEDKLFRLTGKIIPTEERMAHERDLETARR